MPIHATNPVTGRVPWLRGALWRLVTVLVVVYVIVVLALMWWWSCEPPHFDVVATTKARAEARHVPVVTGMVTTSTLMTSAETLLDKRGGYLSNDKLPPGVLMDNVPNWEFGVLTATRDLARELRNRFSRSQSQSEEDVDQLFTLTGEDGEGVSSLVRLGAKSGYEGMGTKLAGYGQYALAVYSSGMRLYAAGKTPAVL